MATTRPGSSTVPIADVIGTARANDLAPVFRRRGETGTTPDILDFLSTRSA